jgi:hypothetical protein
VIINLSPDTIVLIKLFAIVCQLLTNTVSSVSASLNDRTLEAFVSATLNEQAVGNVSAPLNDRVLASSTTEH